MEWPSSWATVKRILAALSVEIAPYAAEMRATVEILAELDFIFAKGLLSREMYAVTPKLNQNGYLNIIRGRHPLIDPEKVVPSNLWLGKDFTSLIITGPGKLDISSYLYQNAIISANNKASSFFIRMPPKTD